MREYKFRGRSIEPLVGDDQWLYGFGVHVVELTDGGKEYWLYTDNGTYQVDPETVGQYTGLKDRNGKEIYEGDIIQFEDMGEEGYEYKEGYDFINRAIVTFENGRFTLDEFMDTNSGVVEELADHEETYSVIQHSEVIGNRWDNPDLLEGGYE